MLNFHRLEEGRCLDPRDWTWHRRKANNRMFRRQSAAASCTTSSSDPSISRRSWKKLCNYKSISSTIWKQSCWVWWVVHLAKILVVYGFSVARTLSRACHLKLAVGRKVCATFSSPWYPRPIELFCGPDWHPHTAQIRPSPWDRDCDVESVRRPSLPLPPWIHMGVGGCVWDCQQIVALLPCWPDLTICAPRKNMISSLLQDRRNGKFRPEGSKWTWRNIFSLRPFFSNVLKY